MLSQLLLTLILLIRKARGQSSCPEGCLSCDAAGVCAACDLERFYYPVQSSCKKAIIRRCAKISANGKCAQCLPGNYIFRNALCVGVVPIDGCLAYDPTASASVCLQCDSSRLLYQNACLKPIAQCLNYDPQTGLCIECQKEYKLALTWKQCLRGTIKNCDSYDRIGYCVKCNENAPRLSLRREACLPLIDKCLLHSSSQNLCLVCDVGTLLSDDSKKCLTETPGCKAYQSSTGAEQLTCKECKTGFALVQSENSLICKNQLKDCENFDGSSNTCIFCKVGFLLTDDKTLCLPSISNCQKNNPSSIQSDGLTCNTCNMGFGPSADKKQCLQIKIANCSEVNQTDVTCNACDSGFILRIDKMACLKAIDNCKEFESTTPTSASLTCKTCADNFALTINKLQCAILISNCKNYKDDNLKCAECLANFVFDSTLNLCFRNITNCVAYSENKGACVGCSDNFRPTNDGLICLRAIKNCLNYLPSDAQTTNLACQVCDKGFSLNTNSGICFAEITNCKNYTNDFLNCDLCKDQFRQTDDKKICLPVISNCANYSASSQNSTIFTCESCEAGFLLNSGKTSCQKTIENCVQTTEKNTCQKCQTGFSATDDFLKCLPEIRNCVSYAPSNVNSSQLQCLSCAENYEIKEDQNACLFSIANCDLVNSTTDKCEQCRTGFVSANAGSECLKAIDNCADYSSLENVQSLQCKACQNGYELFVDGHFCVQKIENCLLREDTAFKCVKCADGFVVNKLGFKCVPAISNCLSWDFDPTNQDKILCNKCAANFVLEQNNSQCGLVISGCSSKSADGQTCLQCEEGKVLALNATLCLVGIANCLNYNESTAANGVLTCNACLGNYELAGNSTACVQKVENCESRDPLTFACLSCADNFALTSDALKCLKAIPFCFQYLPSSNLTTDLNCSICNKGYELANNSLVCQPVIDNCLSRDGNFLCAKCKDSFLPTSDGLKCLPVVANCQTYKPSDKSSSSLFCAACIPNYNLADNICSRAVEIPKIDNCEVLNGQTATCTKCVDGFRPNPTSTACLKEITNCLSYADNANSTSRLSCSACSAGNQPTSDGALCLPAIPNCAAYLPSTGNSSSLSCQSCSQNYDLQAGKCVKIGLDNCLLYVPVSDTCRECDTGFLATDDSRQCLPEIDFCVEFDPSDVNSPFLTCKQCLSTFLFSQDKRKCFPPIKNCLEYSPSFYNSTQLNCKTCEIAYDVQLSGACALKVIPNCRGVNLATGTCSACAIGFLLTSDSQKCLPEIYKCAAYKPSNSSNPELQCQTCLSGFSLTNDFKCINGTVLFCTNFDAASQRCLACDLNKRVTSDGLKCLDPVSNCTAYLPSTKDSAFLACQTCANGFQVFNQGQNCAAVISRCSSYNPTTLQCAACVAGFQPTTDGARCLASIVNCQVYDVSNKNSTALKCLECAPAFVPDPTALNCVDKNIENCAAVNSTTGLCDQCNSGFRATDDRALCFRKIPHCRLYHNSNVFSTQLQCLQCTAAYQLLGITCILKVIPLCDQIDEQTGNCLTCSDGYRPTDDGQSCLDVIENCLTYASSDKNTASFTCLLCANNTFSANNGSDCPSLIDNCVIYDQRFFYCSQCAEGFVATKDQEKCLPSIANCDFYAFSTIETKALACLFCADGYVLVNKGELCVLAVPPTSASQSNNGTQVASSGGFSQPGAIVCDSGWLLTDDKSKCLPKIAKCAVYSPTTVNSLKNQCLQCDTNYTLSLGGETCVK